MYFEAFGARTCPFHLTPDPGFLYQTPQYREALAGLSYAILARKGFVVLTGEAGTGKTTMLTRFLEQAPVSRLQSSVIVNPTLSLSEFLEAVLLDFGLVEVPASKAQRIGILQGFLWNAHRQGKTSVLIVDEAHKLTPDLLEEIRLLGNFECATEKLLQVALIGQNQLDELLNRDELRQFKQRIALRLKIGPLPSGEVASYIRYRWTQAGGGNAPFSGDATTAVADASRGVPRVINLICDNALIAAFAEDSERVELHHVLSVCEELDFPLSATHACSASPEPVGPVDLAPPAPEAEDAIPEITLERFDPEPPKRPFAARFAERLGLTRKAETA